MNCAADRCSAPKAANGSAKHKLLKATILSSPSARTRSIFTAHSAIRKSTTPTLDIETAVRENSNNTARMVECMGIPGVSSLPLGDEGAGQVRPSLDSQSQGYQVPASARDRGLVNDVVPTASS